MSAELLRLTGLTRDLVGVDPIFRPTAPSATPDFVPII